MSYLKIIFSSVLRKKRSYEDRIIVKNFLIAAQNTLVNLTKTSSKLEASQAVKTKVSPQEEKLERPWARQARNLLMETCACTS